jgi:hypothetical protein
MNLNLSFRKPQSCALPPLILANFIGHSLNCGFLQPAPSSTIVQEPHRKQFQNAHFVPLVQVVQSFQSSDAGVPNRQHAPRRVRAVLHSNVVEEES